MQVPVEPFDAADVVEESHRDSAAKRMVEQRRLPIPIRPDGRSRIKAAGRPGVWGCPPTNPSRVGWWEARRSGYSGRERQLPYSRLPFPIAHFSFLVRQ